MKEIKYKKMWEDLKFSHSISEHSRINCIFKDMVDMEINYLGDSKDKDHYSYTKNKPCYLCTSRLQTKLDTIQKELIKLRTKTFTKKDHKGNMCNEWVDCLSWNDDIKPILNLIKEDKE